MKSDRISVLHLMTGLGFGGAERLVYDLVVDNKDVDIIVQTLTSDIGMLPIFEMAGIKPRVNNLRADGLVGLVRLVRLLLAESKRKTNLVIHAHMYAAMVVACLVKTFNPAVKIVFTPHNTKMKNKLRELIIFLLRPYRNVDVLFTHGEKPRFYHSSRRVVIPNGINIDKFSVESTTSSKPVFLSIGNHSTQKNYSELIEHLASCSREFTQSFEYWIAGDGDLYEKNLDLVQKMDLGHCVKLLGTRKDIPQLLAKASLLLMPSLWEGMPLVLLEAAAAKVPIIATPVGNIPTMVDGGATLVSVEEFPVVMQAFLRDASPFMAKVEGLFVKVAKNYSIQTCRSKHLHLYNTVLFN